jgi:hypothetical protein
MFTSEIEQSLHFENFENKFSLKYILLTRYDIIYQLISQYELVKSSLILYKHTVYNALLKD